MEKANALLIRGPETRCILLFLSLFGLRVIIIAETNLTLPWIMMGFEPRNTGSGRGHWKDLSSTWVCQHYYQDRP